MKMAALLLGVAMAGPSSLLAATPKGTMLMSGESFSTSNSDLITVAQGSASAMIGNFRVTAAEITFDQRKKLLICREVKSIPPGFAAPDAKDVTIPVDVDNFYLLGPAGIVTQPTVNLSATPFYGRIFDGVSPRSAKPTPVAPPFSATLPKLDLNLSRPQP